MTTHTITDGQRAYIADAIGQETSVAFTGRKATYEIVDEPDDAERPWRVRWTIESDNGDTLTLDEWPPLSADEQAELDAAEAERVAAAQADEQRALAEAEAERNLADDARFHDAVRAEVAAQLAALGLVPDAGDAKAPAGDDSTD